MAIDLNTAEKLVRWYNELACGCPLSTRVSRVMGSMGGGVDAAAVRSRPNLEKYGEKKISQRVSNLIEGILLQRALSKPDLVAAAFDMSDRLLYCACNSIRGNFNLSSMTAWESEDAAIIKVTCPYCTIEYGGQCTLVKPIPLMTLFKRKAEQEICPERSETKRLYNALLNSAGGCYQQTSFNGSWTCLIFGKLSSTTIEAEVLVSNKISHTVRLQPVCVCADLLYAICSTTGGSEFAFQARNVSVIEGGEFLYFRYTIFEEGGPFDSKTDIKNLVNTEPTSETDGCLIAANTFSSSSSSEEELPLPPPVKKRQISSGGKMSTTNEVDTHSLLLTILSNNRKGKRKKRKRTINNKLPVEVSSEKIDKCKAEYILPCPQIEEQTINAYQRQNYMSYNNKVIKHLVKINGTEFNLCVRSFRKKYVMPPSHTLFSPPLIIRTSYNRYKIISGVLTFFDRVELEETCGSVTLDNNAAHSAILRLLSYTDIDERNKRSTVMHSYDSEYVGGFGKIITGPGIVLPLTDENDVVAFGARDDSTTVLLTTDNVEFEKTVFRRRKAIRQLLKSHVNWDDSPDLFMSKLANLATGSLAMTQSVISDIRFDSGTCIFHDDMFAVGEKSTQQPPVIAWRRICSPILDPFSENYRVKQLSSIMTSFKNKTSVVGQEESAAAIELRRRIVANAVSVLAATAAQVMHLTNGQLTYIPEGHCVYITMPKEQEKYEANLVINDPIGAGWRILNGEVSLSNNIVSRLETLVEFSCKCVVDAIMKNGMDNTAMKKIVDSMSASSYVYSKIGNPKMAVTTSGNSTVNGVGSLTVITEDGQRHTQIALSEFRVDVITAKGIAINIEPRINGDEGLTSPSILQWYNIHQTESQQENEGEKSQEKELEDVWGNVPIFPISTPKQWRACKISDVETWRGKLIRLHKFDWTCKKSASATQHRSVFDRIAAAVAIITQKTFNDRSRANEVKVKQVPVDASGKIDNNLINAMTLLCDIYGFGINKNRPIVVLEKFQGEDGTKEENYSITLVGNAPNAASVRVIRMMKLKNYSSHIEPFEREELRRTGECSSACKWYEVSPTTVLRYPLDEERRAITCKAKCNRLNEDKTMFLFTPKCFYHTSTSYVHLYADLDGPFDLAKFHPRSRHLLIGNANSTTATSRDIQSQVIAFVERPLIVAAVAANSNITVNNFETARSLGVIDEYEKGNDKTNISLDDAELGVNYRMKIIKIELSLPFQENEGEEFSSAEAARLALCPNTLDLQSTSFNYYECPSETAILKYGMRNPRKRKDEDKIRNKAFLALAL